MGAYTVLEDKRVDEAVERDLRLIAERIREVTPALSIILGGGFGRGEGSVLLEAGRVQPVNDYDIFVVIPDGFEMDMRPLSKEIAREIGIRLIDLIPIKLAELNNLPPSQINYDLKYGGRVLWGENMLELIPMYKYGHVLPESGKTLLLNRLICAIEAFSENFEMHAMTTSERFFLINQTGKVISACVEALLMKKDKYHHSYRKRQEIFTSEFPDKIGLQQLNEYATEFKIRPSEVVTFDPIMYWKEAMGEYLNVISDYLVPASASSKKDLWRLLKKKNNGTPLTNNPVERIEIMLLLYCEMSFFTKRIILSRACEELVNITKTPLPNKGWENLRERTTRLWHELYH